MNTYNIDFRSKFEKVITNDENRQLFINAFENFCNLSDHEASAILWRMMYSSDSDSEYAKADCAKDLRQLGLEDVSQEILSVLKNELRYQYQQCHPNAWEIDIPDSCKDAYTGLRQVTNIIVANQVYKNCFNRVSTSEEEMTRITILLQSDKENFYFGGIRELNFNPEQANYLKQFHTQIYNLFVDVYGWFRVQLSHQSWNESGSHIDTVKFNPNEDLPFTMSETSPETSLAESLSENSDEEPIYVATTKFTALTLESIEAHQELFSSLVQEKDFSSLHELRALGFDLNEVISKEDAIRETLCYIKMILEAKHQMSIIAKAMFS